MPRVRVQYQYAKGPGIPVLLLRWLSLGVAAACFAWGGYSIYDQYTHQEEAETLFQEAMEQSAPPPAATSPRPKSKRPSVPPATAANSRIKLPVARLDIPRLQVSGYVEDGFDAATLRQAIGHSPSSAKPGEQGNIVLAAHRDTFFSGLRGVKLGDSVRLQAPTGKRYEYRVNKVFVVTPADNWVMRPVADRNMVTLITCYPFSFVGHAPQRLIVQAQQLDEVAAPTKPAVKAKRKSSSRAASRRNRI